MRDNTRPIINQIEEAVKDIPGWSPIDQLYTLFNLTYLTADLQGDIVEIGCWCGRSTSVLGTASRLVGNTLIYCVDLFPEKNDWKKNEDGSYSFEVQIGNSKYSGYRDQTVWREPFERDIAPIYEKCESLYDLFMQSISKNGLKDIVEVFRGNSRMFRDSLDPNFKCKLVFIDGDHSYDAVCQDIKNIEPYLVKGGWISFDDAFSHYDGVNRAI